MLEFVSDPGVFSACRLLRASILGWEECFCGVLGDVGGGFWLFIFLLVGVVSCFLIILFSLQIASNSV